MSVPPPLTPAPGEYPSGVSNGDVDWLFRGKSKKLTKKMASDKKPSFEEEDRPKSNLTSQIKDSQLQKQPLPPTQAPKTASPPSEPAVVPESPVSNKTTPKGPVSPTSKAQNPPPPVEKSSKLDKLKIGRTRLSSSSSTSSLNYSMALEFPFSNPWTTSQAQPIPQPVPGRRRSSIIPVNDHTGSDTSTLPSVSRSNLSSGKTRSLFSSLSSKFKSSSSQQPEMLSSPLSKASQGLVGQNGSKQDLASAVTKPPAGIPIEKPRSNSISKIKPSPNDSFFSSLEKETGKFFKRRPSHQNEHRGSVVSASSADTRVVLNKNTTRERLPLKELNRVNMRRVAFAVDKLTYDPQQQIPSRRPKKGNVLIPEDLMAPPPRLSQGISVASTDGKNTMGSNNADQKYSEREMALALDFQRRALLEAEKHSHEAHLSAKRTAYEVSQYHSKSSKTGLLQDSTIQEDEEEDEDWVNSAAKIEIDKPLHMHEKHFEDEVTEGGPELLAPDLSLETIYTRCCHLREILPIPATLKQLKNKSKPLQVLKLLNPKPTLIDALSFSDFIAITPITTVIFDNVCMTTEMLKHFLASLMCNKHLEKLSLRNVAIDEVGWVYLCKFLAKNRSVKKLDISQQRIKSETKANCIRSAMNWDLFIDSLALRGGIEELVINGCKLTDSVFEKLMNSAVRRSTYRLGVASVELNLFKAQIVADWVIGKESKCVGVDIAFNDLSQGQLRPFIEAFKKGYENLKLVFFSLNSTNLNDVSEAEELIDALAPIKTLRFLDLSSLPDLFPGLISKLSRSLPRYPALKRIHFDLNELTSPSIGAISDILPKVDGLFHVSFLGNRGLDHGSAGTLYTAVKLSLTIFNLDLDYDLVPDDLSQKIAFYLMRNMENVMRPEISNSKKDDDENQEELMFDGSLLMETAEKLIVENDKLEKHEDVKLQKIILNALIKRTTAVRRDIHQRIDDLFFKRSQGVLSLEGKELLLRFCLLDASLEKVVHMIEEKSKNFGSGPADEASDSSFVLVDSRKGTTGATANDRLAIINDNVLHKRSSELITAGPILSPHNNGKAAQQSYFQGSEDRNFEPHQVVIESSSDGKSVPVDNLTGMPVLMRSISQTSVHAKEQEQEEGEFHRWGYFMELRNNDEGEENKQEDTKKVPTLNVLPSGNELRDAIIAAKGIESMTDLIDKISTNRVSLEKIYSLDDLRSSSIGSHQEVLQRERKALLQPTPVANKVVENTELLSIDSAEEDGGHVHAVVDEVYDKLLNDAQRVRSNKLDNV